MAAVTDNSIATLDNLPDEVLVGVLCRLSCADIYSTAPRVSHRWRTLARDRSAMGPPVCLGGHTPQHFRPCHGDTVPSDWLTYAHSKDCPRYRHACRDAVAAGRADVVAILYGCNYPLGEAVALAAAARGDVPMLTYLRGIHCPLPGKMCVLAAAGGHLEVLRFAGERACLWGRDTCKAAARGGHLDVLKYAHENGCTWDESTCTAAAKGGHLACLQYARAYGCPWDHYATMRGAAKRGHLACLRWAVEHGCRLGRWADLVLCDSVRRGHIDVVRYLVDDMACPLSANATETAAESGHLAVLQCLREAGCPWTPNVCRNAAAGGHLDILVYAHEHDCPWDIIDTCRAARAGGHKDCLAYALRHGRVPTAAGTQNVLSGLSLLVAVGVGALGVVFYFLIVYVLLAVRTP
ncbi:ankyrin repeat protein [Pandoravirus inopinatum]|uniref:Ankyrin repeat protein n=1 Tax=Pandoravirus inopinatum TaxID=1605721 RepID=A0A0B5JBW5_9VIRU|nr:ankyrin repeat protein [Pandoravirus inopinatum]AJF97067.1 ankyrin repeat protein [Pandoravirus inopinatum]